MRFILFEAYYRVFYTAGAICIIECFSYFVQGHQLEFFSGLLAFNYQVVDFDFNGDLRRHGFRPLSPGLKEEDCFLLFNKQGFSLTGNCENQGFLFKSLLPGCFESFGLDKPPSHFLALSPNEGRAWFYLFIVYLSYFYCLEVDKTTLNNMLIYINCVNYCILTTVQIYIVLIPGLFKKWARGLFFVLAAFIAVLLFSQSAIFILIAGFEELLLEQLDSELL